MANKIRSLILNFRTLVFCIFVYSAFNTSLFAQQEQWRWNNIERIVVIPDIHGAHQAFTRLLKTTNIVDDSLNWTGGETHLVSLGDLLDRGPDSRKTMDLLMRLEQQAVATGGRVHVVAGNHEIMNLIGDLRYVSRKEFQAFAGDETAEIRNTAFNQFQQSASEVNSSESIDRQVFDQKYPMGYFAHRDAFSAQGKYGSWLMSLPAVVVINKNAFVHGGLPEIVGQHTLESLNSTYRDTLTQYISMWQELIDANILPDNQNEDAGILAQSAILEASASKCVNERQQACLNTEEQLIAGVREKLEKFIQLSNAPILGNDSPFWSRGAIYCRDIFERPILDASLNKLGVTNVIVGHTPTPDARAHTLQNEKLTMLDTGMLVSYYHGRPAALVIENNQQLVQYLDPNEKTTPLVENLPGAYSLTKVQLETALKNGQTSVIDRPAGERIGVGGTWTVQIKHNNQLINALFYPDNRLNQGQKELAAYKLDQLLGFDLVPMTIKRTLNNSEGALQVSYQNKISEATRLDQNILISGWCPLKRQVNLTYVWDILTANSGRNAQNFHYRKNLGLVYLTEHTNAFSKGTTLPKSLKRNSVNLAPEVKQSLKKLNSDMLKRELGGQLDKRSIQAILKRRDAILKRFR